ncbi:hypothetical protein MRX96_054623 [Rhipicephalus microplus]
MCPLPKGYGSLQAVSESRQLTHPSCAAADRAAFDIVGGDMLHRRSQAADCCAAVGWTLRRSKLEKPASRAPPPFFFFFYVEVRSARGNEHIDQWSFIVLLLEAAATSDGGPLVSDTGAACRYGPHRPVWCVCLWTGVSRVCVAGRPVPLTRIPDGFLEERAHRGRRIAIIQTKTQSGRASSVAAEFAKGVGDAAGLPAAQTGRTGWLLLPPRGYGVS